MREILKSNKGATVGLSENASARLIVLRLTPTCHVDDAVASWCDHNNAKVIDDAMVEYRYHRTRTVRESMTMRNITIKY